MKKGFTLIEIIISIAILSIMIFYMYRSIGTLKMSNNLYEKHYNQDKINTMIHKTMFFDLAQSLSASVVNGKFDRLDLQSVNSNFDIIYPYISYIVKDKTLYRVESAKKIPSKIEYEDLRYLKYEIVLKDIEKFRVFKASDSFLVVINKLIFEVAK
jgi:prepilin-type N-terminal cleavage/methylation domain-containing protein